MGYTFDMKPEGGVLRVRVIGSVDDRSSGSHADDVGRIVAACTANECRGILLDVRDVSLELGPSARLQGLMGFANAVPAGVRLAAVGVAQPMAVDGLGRLLAATRGLTYRIFDSDTEAVAWLSAEVPTPNPSLQRPASDGDGAEAETR